VLPMEPETPPATHLAEPPLRARRALWIVVCYFLMQVVGGGIVGFGFGSYAATHHSPRGRSAAVPNPLAAVGVPAAMGGILLGGLVAFRMSRRTFSGSSAHEFRNAIGWSPTSRLWLLAAILSGLTLSAIYLKVLVRLFPPSPGQTWGPLVAAMVSGGWQRHLWALLAVSIVPPVEEFVFRGVLFGGLRRSWGLPAAACLTTILFALFHVTSLHPYLPAMVMVTCVGAAQLWARVASRSLAPSIAMHAAYNIGLVVTVYLGAA